MSSPTIQTLRTRLGLTTGALARLCGVERRTAERWIEGTREPPECAVRLLRLCERPDVRDAVERMAEE